MTAHKLDENLFAAHEAMASFLDGKFASLKEWQAFRAIDRALVSALRAANSAPAVAVQAAKKGRKRVMPEGQSALFGDAPTPYMTLAANALNETGQPITTVALMDYITKRRTITGDPKKARIVVQSSLSKDERFKSIVWNGGRAWWWANQPIPQKQTAA